MEAELKFVLALLALTKPALAQVEVTGAWARATLPHQDAGAAYFSLRSAGGDTLTGVSSPEAGMAMLHQTTTSGGMSSMSDMDNLPLPHGRVVVLAPNGTHIMLMDLKHPLKPGETLHLTLNFAHAAAQTIAVPVRPVSAAGP
jgi:copper(I)-binding protein